MKINCRTNHAMSVLGGIIVIGLAVVIIGGLTILASNGIKRIPKREIPPEDESECTNTLAQLQAIYGTNIEVRFLPPIVFDDPYGLLSTNFADYHVESSTDLVHWVVEPEMTSLEGIEVLATNRGLPMQFFRMVNQ